MYERLIELDPAFDKRDPDPKKDYGVHGVNIRFIYKGPEGAVQFLIYTNWQLPHVTQESLDRLAGHCTPLSLEVNLLPLPADIGYHSPVPRYEGQSLMSDSCPYLDGKPCYYDGSSREAERIYGVLLESGSAGVWAELESYYNELFIEEAVNGPSR